MKSSLPLRGFLHVIVHAVEDFGSEDKDERPQVVHLQVAGQSHYMNIWQGDLSDPVSFQIGSFLPPLRVRSFLEAARQPTRQTVNARRPSITDIEDQRGKKPSPSKSSHDYGGMSPDLKDSSPESQKGLTSSGSWPTFHDISGSKSDSGFRLEIEVLESCYIKNDWSVLGRTELSQDEITAKPDHWYQRRLPLEEVSGSQPPTVSVSLCWEPAQFLPLYLMRIAAVMCFCSAFGLLAVSSSCRWQSKPVQAKSGDFFDASAAEMFAQQQPGVGAAIKLAAFTFICATVIHFLIAHMGDSVHLNSLAAVSSRQLVRGRLRQGPSRGGAGVVMRARATNVLKGEVEVMPNFDWRWLSLPLVALAWMLPVAGVSLTCLAFFVQIQDWSLEWCAGEMLAVAALFCALLGYMFAHMADGQRDSQSPDRDNYAADIRYSSRHSDQSFTDRVRKFAGYYWNEVWSARKRWTRFLIPRETWAREVSRNHGHAQSESANSLSWPLQQPRPV